MIEFGSKCKDRFTNFEGFALGRSEYFNGCVQYLVKPPVDKDGKSVEGLWIDEATLIVLASPTDEDRKARDGAYAGVKQPGGPDHKSLPVQ